tara:strand:+ start:623 stop:1621 length:999 start_codon:yes stop_codon:yes gene_type:complete
LSEKIKIAITGASGFIGQELVSELLNERSFTLALLSRNENTNTLNTDKCNKIFIGDLCDKYSLEEFVKDSTVIINLAGEYIDEDMMTNSNYIGVKNLYELAEEYSVPNFIHVSSVGVYGRPAMGLINEDSKLLAINEYEETKVLADKFLIDKGMNKNNGTKIIILRPSNIFSPRMRNQSLKQLYSHVKRGTFFYIGRRGAIANYLYLNNFIDALICIIKQRNFKSFNTEIFNLNQADSLENFISYLKQNDSRSKINLRFPASLVYFFAYLSDIISSQLKFRLPITVDRVNALTSRAEFSQTRFEKVYRHSYKTSMKQALKECIDYWSEEKND